MSLRSSVESQKYMLRDKIQIIADEYCDTCIFENDYPGWQYRKESPLREKAIALYEKLFDKKAEVAAIHAGLECGYWDNKKTGAGYYLDGAKPLRCAFHKRKSTKMNLSRICGVI